jgi:hypothetical protein
MLLRTGYQFAAVKQCSNIFCSLDLTSMGADNMKLMKERLNAAIESIERNAAMQ